MRNKIFLTLASVLMAGSMLAQDFTYQGINYTVLDPSAKTATTKAGTNASNPGNTITGKVSIPSKVVYNNNEYTVTEIGEYSFNYPDVTSVDFSPALTAIRSGAFRGAGLTEVYVPDNVTTIEQQAFAYCPDLKTVTIGKGVNYITYLFFQSKSLETVVFKGEEITEVGTGTFAYCNSLKSITIYTPTPPKTNSAAFAFMSPSSVTLNVPLGSENAYKNATTWNSLNIVGVELPTDEPEQPSAGNVFSLVTNLDQIGDQAEIIILDSKDEFALGNDYRGDLYKNNRSAVTDFVKNSDGTVTPGEEVCIATITKKDNGYVIFAPIASDPTKGYLSMASPYYVNTSASEDQAAVLTITINETTGVAAVTDGSYYLGVNLLAGNYFKCTTSSSEGNNFRIVKLYVRGGEAPEQPEQPSAGNVFRYVADLAELGTKTGDKAEVVFVAPNGTKAMSTEFYTTSNKKTGLASTSNFTDNGDGTITIGDDVAVLTMKCVNYSPPYSNYYTFEMMNGDNQGFMVGSASSSPEMSFTASESGASEMIADLPATLGDGSTGYRFSYNRSATAYNYLVYTNDAFQFVSGYNNQSYYEPYKIFVRDTSAVEPEEPEQPASNVFTLVTSLDQIGDQAEIIILDSQDAFAMGKEYRSSSDRNSVTDFVKNSDGTVTPGETVSVATITKKDNGYVIFAPMASDPAKGYLQLNGSILDTWISEDLATVLTITIDEKTGVAIVKNESNRYLTANPYTNPPYFRTNTSSNESITSRNLKFYMRAASTEEPEEPIEPEEPTGNDFTLVTNIDQIGDEAEVIILDSQDEFAMGKEYFRSSAKYHRNAVTDFVKNSDGTVTPGEQVSIATITKKDNGYVIFAPMASNPALGYLNLNTVLDTYEREDEATVLTITIDEKTGVAIVKSEDNRYLGVDPRNDQFRSNVTSTEGDAHRNVKLYVRGSSAVEPEQPEEPDVVTVPTSIFMNVGEAHDLSVYLNGNAEVRTMALTASSWTSSAPEVTSVTTDGNATGVDYGTAVITANDAAGKAILSVNTYVGTTLTVVYPDGSKVEHHVPYNTKANVTIEPSSRWRIESASHDGTDVTDAVKAGKYVSAEPLTGNSTITLAAEEYNEPTTGTEGIETACDIRLLVNGRVLTITGADDNDTVGVYDLKGMAVYQGLAKTIELSDSGVYIVRVGTKVYKLAVL